MKEIEVILWQTSMPSSPWKNVIPGALLEMKVVLFLTGVVILDSEGVIVLGLRPTGFRLQHSKAHVCLDSCLNITAERIRSEAASSRSMRVRLWYSHAVDMIHCCIQDPSTRGRRLGGGHFLDKRACFGTQKGKRNRSTTGTKENS